MPDLDTVVSSLRSRPRTWLVTGAAGFIGSHVTEALLGLKQRVIALDDLSTGTRANLDAALENAPPGAELEFVEGDVRDRALCEALCRGADLVLHQAALTSVPDSIADPVSYTDVNVTGFVSIARAAAGAGVERLVYASSCAVYGDAGPVVKSEETPARPISPYALSKLLDESYAAHFHEVYGLASVGLRYFNVYGARQLPGGAYGAVIPRWIDRMLRGEPCLIYGDGKTTRDLCHVSDVVRANLLAALGVVDSGASVFNVGTGRATSLLELHGVLREVVRSADPSAPLVAPDFLPERPGDIRHIRADLERASRELGFSARTTLREGLAATVRWAAERPEAGALAVLPTA